MFKLKIFDKLIEFIWNFIFDALEINEFSIKTIGIAVAEIILIKIISIYELYLNRFN